jgi:hypothetical protein
MAQSSLATAPIPPAWPKWNIGNDPTLADHRKRATILGSAPPRMSYWILDGESFRRARKGGLHG